MITRRLFTGGVVLSPFLHPIASPGSAQERYPAKPIQIVVGFPVGQSSDLIARIIAKSMSAELEQPMYVDNKPGAASIIGHQYLKTAPADGYTVGLSSIGPMAINPTLYKTLSYDPQSDFESIILLSQTPLFLFASKSSSIKSVRDMIAYVRAKSGQVSYGSGGNGVIAHITMELLRKRLQIDVQHIPYKGASPMLTDLVAGRIDFAFEAMSAAGPLMRDGRIVPLGISTLERNFAAPNVPTIHEQGVDGFESSGWAALIAPKGTPSPIIQRLNEAANASLKTKEVIDYYASVGSIAKGGTPRECADFTARERRKWAPVILDSGAQID